MIAGDPPIPIPPATSPLPSLVLDLEPTVAGPPQGIDLGQMYERHLYYVMFFHLSYSVIYISVLSAKYVIFK